MKRLILMAASIFCLAAPVLGADPASIGVCPEDKLIMGTGDSKGTYAVMSRNIAEVCPMTCEYLDETGKPSDGGFMNANLLTKRKIDVGLVPEDVLELSKRTDPLVSKKVRVLGNLHFNTLHIIVNKAGTPVEGNGFKIGNFDTGLGKKANMVKINYLSELKGLPVAVFSSAVVTMTLANERLGYDIQLVTVNTKEEGFQLLESGQVFAFMTTGGWPITWVDKADPKKFTLANVSDEDIKKLGAPFHPVALNYQSLGAFGVKTFGARNVIAVYDYTSQRRIKQLLEFKGCIADGLGDIQELRGSHPSWVDVDDFDGESVSWLKYDQKLKE